MAAPIVSRPPIDTASDKAPGAAGMPTEWVNYAKWAVLASVVLGALALVVIMAVSLVESSKKQKVRSQWDAIYNAVREKVKPEDQIAALEGVSQQVAGTPVHAFVLMQLGDLHFEQSTKDEKKPEERSEALKKAAASYKMVLDTPEYKSNPMFGPLAAQSLGVIYEQSQDYDNAIATLAPVVEQSTTHFASEMMAAQLARVYWLRSEHKAALAAAGTDKDNNTKAAEADRKVAREKLADVVQKRQPQEIEQIAWLKEANYILSLLKEPGKGLADGKIPPAKAQGQLKIVPPGAPKAAPGTDGSVKAPPKKIKVSPPASTPKAPEVPKPDTKTPAPADAGKDTEKLASGAAAATPIADGNAHLSYAQMAAMLKQGKSALCLCVRCDDSTKAIGAKLSE